MVLNPNDDSLKLINTLNERQISAPRGKWLDYSVPEGRPIPGAFNFLLTGDAYLPKSTFAYSDSGGDHSYVWNGFLPGNSWGEHYQRMPRAIRFWNFGTDLNGDGKIDTAPAPTVLTVSPNVNFQNSVWGMPRLLWPMGNLCGIRPRSHRNFGTPAQDQEHTSDLLWNKNNPNREFVGIKPAWVDPGRYY